VSVGVVQQGTNVKSLRDKGGQPLTSPNASSQTCTYDATQHPPHDVAHRIARSAFPRAHEFFARVLPKVKSRMELNWFELAFVGFVAVDLQSHRQSVGGSQTSNSSSMNNQSRIELLSGVKSAVNAASFAPTEGRIKEAKAAIASLMSYVESLEAPKKPKRRRKTKQKSGKATAATRIADRQERAFHGKADTPVTPRHTKRTASVEEARKAAQEVSDKSGATARAERKASLIAKAIEKEAVVSPVASPDAARLADLEAKIEALIALQSMGHDVMRNENEVLFSDLPFDPTSNL
jgi:hypothetical protein